MGKEAVSNRIEFADHVRLMRKEDGMSLSDLAKKVGVSAAHLSAVENGKSPASPELADALITALVEPGVTGLRVDMALAYAKSRLGPIAYKDLFNRCQ